jgi:hypothetical protein
MINFTFKTRKSQTSAKNFKILYKNIKIYTNNSDKLFILLIKFD